MSLREMVWLFHKHISSQEALLHRNARLTEWGRRELVRRVLAGSPVAHVAEQMNVSRATAGKWCRRHLENPDGAWWADRSSRPHHSPKQTSAKLEARIVALRRRTKRGPARIAGQLDLAPSTVHRVLVRHGCNRLAWMDRPTGQVIRRYEHDQPGDLVHIDIKKLGKVPPGGGWRAQGRSTATRSAKAKRPRIGYGYIHSIVDDHSRVAYSEVLDDERADTTVAFFRRARAWFADHGIVIRAVLSDNGPCYTSRLFRAELADAGIKHRLIRPYRPQTNGKVERFNRTLLDEWAYARTYRSEPERRQRLDSWLHTYNHHRHHTAVNGPPNPPRQQRPGSLQLGREEDARSYVPVVKIPVTADPGDGRRRLRTPINRSRAGEPLEPAGSRRSRDGRQHLVGVDHQPQRPGCGPPSQLRTAGAARWWLSVAPRAARADNSAGVPDRHFRMPLPKEAMKPRQFHCYEPDVRVTLGNQQP